MRSLSPHKRPVYFDEAATLKFIRRITNSGFVLLFLQQIEGSAAASEDWNGRTITMMLSKGQVGSQATLAQISTVKAPTAKRQDIMNAPPTMFHPDAAQAGMLVVHGQHPQQNGGGPPPLQQQGFGVGYRNAPHMGGGGYGYR